MRILGVGEVLWDITQSSESLGGAPLNFCASSVRFGEEAALITAVGRDERGRLALEQIAALGIDCQLVSTVAEPTGIALNHPSKNPNPGCRIPHPSAFDSVIGSRELLDQACALRPDWIYIGTLFHKDEPRETLTTELARRLHQSRIFYDVNLRAGEWDIDLVRRLAYLAAVVKVNDREARVLARLSGHHGTQGAEEAWCREWAAECGLECICITRGGMGCTVYAGDRFYHSRAVPAKVLDPIGAGDAFAAAFLHGYHRGWQMDDTMLFANVAGSIAVRQKGAVPQWTPDECRRLSTLAERAETRIPRCAGCLYTSTEIE